MSLSDLPTAPGAKIAKWQPPKDLYGEIRKILPDLSAGAVASLCQEWQSRYRKARLQIHLGRQSLPSVRYPQPMTIRAQDLAISVEEVAGRERLVAEFRTASTAADDARRWRVTLEGGPGFRRPVQQTKAALGGKGEITSALLDAIPAKARADQSVPARDRTGQRIRLRPVLRIVCRLPRVVPAADRAGKLVIETGTDYLLRWRTGAESEFRPPLWIEHVKRRLEWFDRQQGRLRDDLKFEKQWPREIRQQIVGNLTRLSQGRTQMLRTACQQAAQHVVGYAGRRKTAVIEWDGSRGLPRHWPMAQLVEAVRQAAETEGFAFAEVSLPTQQDAA